MNKVVLIGRLGKDAEVTPFQNGKKVTKFSLATTESYGKKKETVWHSIDIWGDYGSDIAPYLKKGGQVGVEGRISYNAYEAPDGTKKVFTSIVCDRVYLLDSKRSSDERDSQAESYPSELPSDDNNPATNRPSAPQFSAGTTDDLPF